MLNEITVVSIEAGDYFIGESTSGSTVDVTLERDGVYVKCEGILIWESEYCDNDLFDEWLSYAEDGEEGYTTWTD